MALTYYKQFVELKTESDLITIYVCQNVLCRHVKVMEDPRLFPCTSDDVIRCKIVRYLLIYTLLRRITFLLVLEI